MQIIPIIELLEGRCVSLLKGNLDDPMLWHVDPVETARGFAAAGASGMGVTDFDAIKGGQGNDDLIAEIILKAGIPVQVGGGIRTTERAEHWIAQGAAQVVIGTLATQMPEEVKALAMRHPDQIVLALDIWQGKLMTHGWGTESALDPVLFLESFADVPLSGVIVTDIDSDANEVDKQLGVISTLGAATRHRVIGSGMVDKLDDIASLKYVSDISAAIIGRALMRKAFSLEDALSVAQPEPEPVAHLG
jgi:phosphoribosylformimino-5-aminoimidazole carboxamide ribotide isomerase